MNTTPEIAHTKTIQGGLKAKKCRLPHRTSRQQSSCKVQPIFELHIFSGNFLQPDTRTRLPHEKRFRSLMNSNNLFAFQLELRWSNLRFWVAFPKLQSEVNSNSYRNLQLFQVRPVRSFCIYNTGGAYGNLFDAVTTVTTRSLRGHYAVTTRSLRGHYAVTTVTTRSLRGH